MWRESSRFYHIVSIRSRDAGQLHYQSQSFVYSFFVRKNRGYIRSQQDQVCSLPVSVRIFTSYSSLEQLGQIVFRSKLVIHSSLLLHIAFFPWMSVPGQ